MTNKNKIINQAQKFIQKGQWDKAIKELQKLVAEDPSDVRTLLKLGDVYAKKGDREQATRVYKQVAESYSEQGFFLKAVAVYKQILKHDQKNLEVTLKLAELYEHLGLTSEAMVQYQVASQIHDETGNAREGLDVLKRMVELDAENVASRIKLAESYSRENMVGDAIEQFQRASEILKRQGRVDDYIKVAERLVYHDPNRLEVIKELASIYVSRGDTKRGLAKLQLCFKAQPRDVETLTLLAGAFRDLGQLQKTVFVYRELARIHQENGDDIAARATLQKIIEIDPSDPEARTALGMGPNSSPNVFGAGSGRMAALGNNTGPFGAGTGPLPQQQQPAPMFGTGSGPQPQPFGMGGGTGYYPAPAPVPQPSALPRAPSIAPRPQAPVRAEAGAWRAKPAPVQEEEPFTVGDENLDFGSAPRAMSEYIPQQPQPIMQAQLSPQPQAQPTPQPFKNDSVQISKILTETDVYIKYGLRDKALEHLRKIFEIDPDNVLAYTKMRDIYLAAGDSARAAEAIANLVHIHAQHSDEDALQGARAELERLAPGHPLIAGNSSGSNWTFGQQSADAADSIDITEDSDVYDLNEVADEPATADSLDAWLQQDPSDMESAEELLPTEEPGPAENDPYSLYPQFAGQQFEDSSSGVSVIDRDIVESSAAGESGLHRSFDDSGFETEATESGIAARQSSMPLDENTDDDPFNPRTTENEDVVRIPIRPNTADLDLGLSSPLPAREDELFLPETTGLVENAMQEEDLPEASVSAVVALEDLSADLAFAPLSKSDPPQPPSWDDGSDTFGLVDNGPSNGAHAFSAHFAEAEEETKAAELSPEEAQEIEDELDEAEFLAQQGLEDDARELLESVLAKAPHNVRAQQIRATFDSSLIGMPKPSDLEEESSAAEQEAEAAYDEPADEEPENPAEVTAISDNDLSDAFDNLGSAEPDENPDDHYDEGMAYKELGRLDDAISHFKIAMRSPTREIAALEMIGQCLLAKNDFEGAINSFWTALERGPEQEAATNLKFEIANAYEVAGDLQQAVVWYGACYSEDPQHRDVADRLRNLENGAPQPASSGSPAASAGKKSKISYL